MPCRSGRQLRQWGWFVALWIGGVTVTAALAYFLKLFV